MSNEKRHPSLMSQITSHFEFTPALRRFFTTVGGMDKCEACGTEKWIQMPGNPRYVLSQSEHPERGMELMAICCANCGNTRLFNWDRIKFFMATEITQKEADKDAQDE